MQSPRAIKRLSGCCVLVVEDEHLVSMLLEDALAEAGATVVGPADSIEKARSLLQREPLAAAVLDLDIAGELVYPLADELVRRGVPFIFVTGYVEYPSYQRASATRVFLKPFSVSTVVAEVARVARRYDPQS
jgi:DNA-binding response OmpR family regulator